MLFLSHLLPQISTNEGVSESRQTWRGFRPQANHPDLEQKETELTEAAVSPLTQLPPVQTTHAERVFTVRSAVAPVIVASRMSVFIDQAMYKQFAVGHVAAGDV